ncbi:histidine--tRNA ligase [Candidatus Gracilibacteria bacterium]|nr:histidine--tRNA ligase [Candidatus Gracilibacteria bacterium]
MQLKTTPPKGTADWFPEEYRVRKYIFDTWREVCQKYGFEEYLGPLVEDSAIWKAKSGEDVGGSEMTLITDREGNLSELALRPEMTPTVTRMVSRVWKEKEKPMKWFSIANFYRNERPQRGRNREFWQLNADIFGEESIHADIETLCLVLDLMLAFNPPKHSFTLKLNHRGLIDHFFEHILGVDGPDRKQAITRILDKYEKLKKDVFDTSLSELGLDVEQVQKIYVFLESTSVTSLIEQFPSLESQKVLDDILYITRELEQLGYGAYITFSPSLIRGFDYYDGLIFEVFDLHPDNTRALFGGGRYNGLADIFGVKQGIPAIGFGPGDEPMKLFLESWNMVDSVQAFRGDKYYIPLLENIAFSDIQNIAQKLRKSGKSVVVGTSVKKITKAMKFADKQNFSHIILYGESEKSQQIYTCKHLSSGEENIISL